MKIKETFREFAYTFRNSRVANAVFGKAYQVYKDNEKKRKLNVFHKYGLEALSEFNNCLKNHQIKFSLAFGSLLGAVREHGFIPHDDDLDFMMWIDDYKPEMIEYLKECGFKHKYSFSVSDDSLSKEDTFEYKGVLLDVFYLYKNEAGMPYCCYYGNQPNCPTRRLSQLRYGGLMTYKVAIPISDRIIDIDFKGLKVPIPENYQEVLKKVFGEDYMTPIPGWSHDNYSEVMPDWLCKYKEY